MSDDITIESLEKDILDVKRRIESSFGTLTALEELLQRKRDRAAREGKHEDAAPKESTSPPRLVYKGPWDTAESIEEAKRLSVLEHLRDRYDYAPIGLEMSAFCARCGKLDATYTAYPCGCMTCCDACHQKHLSLEDFALFCPRCGRSVTGSENVYNSSTSAAIGEFDCLDEEDFMDEKD